MEASFALNAANTFTGPLEIRRGSVYLGNANALTQTNALMFNPVAGQNARLFLYGNNATVSDLLRTLRQGASRTIAPPRPADDNAHKTAVVVTRTAATSSDLIIVVLCEVSRFG